MSNLIDKATKISMSIPVNSNQDLLDIDNHIEEMNKGGWHVNERTINQVSGHNSDMIAYKALVEIEFVRGIMYNMSSCLFN